MNPDNNIIVIYEVNYHHEQTTLFLDLTGFVPFSAQHDACWAL